MILLILLFLAIAFGNDDNPCDFVSNQLYDDPSKIVSCLKTLPFDENNTEITGLIPLIEDYLESFVFLDVLKNPPAPYESLKTDLFAELDVVNNHIFDVYDNAYDFYWAVASVFSKLKDAHTFFYMPCAGPFYWILPYFFSASSVDGNITITAQELTTANITAHYINDNNGTNITGKVITKIDLNGDGYKDAWVAIADFADNFEYISKDPNARLNRVLLNDFFNRHATVFPYPGSSISVQYLDDDNIPTDLTMPFYARSTASINITSVNDVCPLLNSTSTSNATTTAAAGTVAAAAVGAATVDVSGKKKKHLLATTSIKKQQPPEIKKSVAEAAPSATTNPTSKHTPKPSATKTPHTGTATAAAAGAATAGGGHRRRQELLRRLEREEHRRTLEMLETVEQHGRRAGTSPHSPPHSPSSRSSPSRRHPLLHSPAPFSSPSSPSASPRLSPSSPSSSPSPLSSSSSAGNGSGSGSGGEADPPSFATIANNSFLLAGVVAEQGIGYIRLFDFSGDGDADDPIADWGQQVGSAVKALKTDPFVQYLLVDLRSNGGGYVSLGMQLNKFLFPSIFPVYGIYDVVHSRVNLEMSKIPVDPDDAEYHRNTTLDILTDWYNESVEHNFTELNGTAYKRNFSQTWMLDLGDRDVFAPVAGAWADKPPSPLFDAQHVLLVTDGLCGSTCACFLKHIQEEQLGRIVGVGGYPGHNTPASFDSASFSGGTVFSASGVYSIKTAPEVQQYINPANLPNPFPRNTTELRWAEHEIYSYTTAPTVLEFKVNPVDFVVPLYPSLHSSWPENVLRLISTLLPYYNVCAAHEVKASPGDCSEANTDNDTDNSTANAVYGHPCVAYPNGTYGWDTDTCVFAHCTDGFFLNHTSGTCDAVPILYYPPHPQPPAQKKKKSKLLAVFIVVGIAIVVVVVLIAIVSVAVFLLKKKKGAKKQQEKATATEPSYAKM